MISEKNHRFNLWIIFSVMSGLYLVIGLINNALIFDGSFYERSIGMSFTNDELYRFIETKNTFNILSYLIIPLILLLKLGLIAAIISTGIIISNKNLHFNQVLRTVLLAEFIFVLASFLHSCNMYLNKGNISLDTLPFYYPLSIVSIIGPEKINSDWAIYPLQTANLFEVFYVIAISWLLSRNWKPNFFESLNVVIPSYGLGLVLWVILVAFLTLQVS